MSNENALALAHEGVQFHQRGRLEEAVHYYEEAAKVLTDLPLLFSNLGLACVDLGRSERALQALTIAKGLAPDHPEVLLNLAHYHQAERQYESAIELLNRVLDQNPSNPLAWTNLALNYKKQGRLDEAKAALLHALHHDPHFVNALINLGTIVELQGRWDEAIACYRRAVACQPDGIPAWTNLAFALQSVGRFEEALDIYPRILRGGRVLPLVNYIHLLEKLGRDGEAEAACRQGMAQHPESPDLEWAWALFLLRHGRWREGWPHFEARRRLDRWQGYTSAQPLWEGQPLAGRRILVFFEQGFGDTFFGLRYLPELKELGAEVLVAGPRSLKPLLASVGGMDAWVDVEKPWPDHDYHVYLLSLPGLFETSPARVHGSAPYFEPPAPLVDHWKERLANINGLRVGIAWQGSTTYPDDALRSFPLAQFKTLARIPGVRLVGLQHGSGLKQLKNLDFPLYHFPRPIDGPDAAFLHTAAVMKNLDLVISSDTSVPHLAGALGLPVWVLLKKVPDWRWLLDGESCPWYSTMRLFRQARWGDWDEVFERVAQALCAFDPTRLQ